MAWSDAARAAALAARRAHAHGTEQRRARSKATHKPSTGFVQQLAKGGEAHVVAALNQGKHIGGTKPMDIVTNIKGRTHGIEVKTLVHNSNQKLTMHKSSRLRKLAWAASNNAALHTVAVDSKTNQIYYRAGVGSFHVKYMQPVSISQLRKLIKGSKR